MVSQKSEESKSNETAGYHLDASVIIDYQDSDSLHLLSDFADCAGPVCVCSTTLEGDAASFTRQHCDEHGLMVVDPSFDQGKEAEALKEADPRLSWHDVINLIVARDGVLTLITNDRVLWKTATEWGVAYIRGLRIMIELVRRGRLDPTEAVAVAKRIAKKNEYITKEVVGQFKRELGRVGRRAGPNRRRQTPRGGDAP